MSTGQVKDETDLRIVKFITDFLARNGHSPSMDEIGQHIGMTRQGAQQRINRLVKARVLGRKRGQHRALSINRQP